VLGVAVSVLAVASLGIFGNVLALGAEDAVGDIGNQVVVSPNADAGVETLTDSDVTAVRRAADGVAVVPLKADRVIVSSASDRQFTTVYGTDRPADLYVAAEGELPERHRQGAIVGSELAATLDVGVGETIEIEGTVIRVIAVLAESETFSPVAPDTAVFLPEAAFTTEGYNQVVVAADSGAEARAAADGIRTDVNAREERVEVFELAAVVQEIEEFFDLLGTFLLGLGGISLFVAGVSILNVMLMSTVERRAEIGVMRAVGIERRDVLRMLLAEAGLIGAAGAAIGVVLTVIVVAAFVLATPAEPALALDPTNGYYLLLALGFGVAVGLVGGVYPAWRAANERPVEALRD